MKIISCILLVILSFFLGAFVPLTGAITGCFAYLALEIYNLAKEVDAEQKG